MRYRYAIRVTSEDLGKRVTVRYRTSDGAATDVVGILETCDDAAFNVRRRTNELVTIPRPLVIAAKVV